MRYSNFIYREGNLNYIIVCMLAIAAWFFLNPYLGVRHDGILYAAIASNLLEPEVFAKDLFFQYGFQGKFTLFPLLYAALIKLTNFEFAALIISLVGQIVFVSGALYLASKILNRTSLLLFIVFVVGLPGYTHIFPTFEFYQTSRPFAMGFVLFALAAQYQLKWKQVSIFLFLSVLMHPLIAIAGISIVLLQQSIRKLIILSGLIALLVMSLFFLDIAPFSSMFNTFDEEWLSIVEQRSPFLFIESLDRNNWGLIKFFAGINLFAIYFSESKRERIFFSANLIVLISLLLTAYIGADIYKNIFITQLQLWRGIFLFFILSLMALSKVLYQLSKTKEGLRVIIMLVALYLMVRLLGGWWVSLVFLAHALTEKVCWQRKKVYFNVLSAVFICFALFHWLPIVYRSFFIGNTVWGGDVLLTAGYVANNWPILIVLFLLGTYFLLEKFSIRGLGKGVIPLFFVWPIGEAVAYAYTRPGVDKAIDNVSAVQNVIPANSVVFWSGDIKHGWFELKRSHYVSAIQMAAVVFNRELAVEGAIRLKNLRNAGFKDGELNVHGYGRLAELPEITEASIKQLCVVESILDYVITPAKYGEATLTFKTDSQEWFIYPCSKLRL